MEAYYFTASNEDYKWVDDMCTLCVCSEGFSSRVHSCVVSSLYTYDMRYLEKPVLVHIDHVSAVLDVDYSPTGKEFVSASFDKTIRIFPKDCNRSRLVTPAYLLACC